MNPIKLFTDGACKSNGKHGARASYACYFPDYSEWSFAKEMPQGETQTNQRGELKAICEGVKVALEKCGAPSEFSLHIYTDSTYSRDCLTTWLPGWLRNDWKTAAGKPVIHRDLIELTTTLLPRFKEYIITYVKAHTGKQDELSIGNDVVDKMAVSVLAPVEELKEISVSDTLFEGLPLSILGAPLEEKKIIDWCKINLDKLDPQALKVGLFSAFQRTIRKNGYDSDIQVINKTRFVRLVTKSLIKEGVTIIKKE